MNVKQLKKVANIYSQGERKIIKKNKNISQNEKKFKLLYGTRTN